MSKIIELTQTNKMPVAIPVSKITGITKVHHSMKSSSWGRCFICTGPDGQDGAENGWYVMEEYEIIRPMLDSALES